MARGESKGGYGGQTYYGQSGVKEAPWDWTVNGYVYLAGMSGAAQILAAIGQGLDRHLYRHVIRNARYLATTGTAIGAILLIADLRTPRRWYNMLRILRPTSPMSVGTYILGAFGGFSAVTATGELLRHNRLVGRLARWCSALAQWPAALAGAGASTYTASLLSSTSTPYWAAVPRQLGVSFATAAVASAAAALSLFERLAGRGESARRLDDVAVAATLAHLVSSMGMERRHRETGIASEMSGAPSERVFKTGDYLIAGAVPLGAYALNRLSGGRSPVLSVIGSLAIIGGGYMMRHGLLYAGRESAKRPRAYFRFAQPEMLPDRRRSRHREDGHA